MSLLERVRAQSGPGVLSLMLVFLAVGLHAEEGSHLKAAPARRDDLQALIQEALEANPGILAAQKTAQAAEQRPSQETSLPDPMFSPSYASTGRPWPGAGVGRDPVANIGFMISQEVPSVGKRKLKGLIAENEARQELHEYRAVQLGVIAKVKEAYYRRVYAFDALTIIGRQLDLLRMILGVIQARYSAGQAAQQDVFNAQTQIAIFETRKIQLQRDEAARRAELASLLNRTSPLVLVRPAPLATADLPANVDSLLRHADAESPELRKGEEAIRAAESAARLSHKEYYPNYTIKGGYFSMGSMGPMYQVGVDLPVPVYFFRKQRFGVIEREQQLQAERQKYQSTVRSLAYRIQDEYLSAEASSRLAQLYSDTVIPQASMAMESALASYQTGKAEFQMVLLSASTVAQYQMSTLDERLNVHLALVRLEEMTGKVLVDGER